MIVFFTNLHIFAKCKCNAMRQRTDWHFYLTLTLLVMRNIFKFVLNKHYKKYSLFAIKNSII